MQQKVKPSAAMVQNAGIVLMHAEQLKAHLTTVEAADTGVPVTKVQEEIAAIRRWLVQTENAFANSVQVTTA